MKKIISICLCLLSVICSYAQKQQAQSYTKQIQEFDTYVENARKAWGAPGLAVAIVKDNQIIFKKGYGTRQLGKNEPVDTQTLFACASTTKAMTATCIGMLVDEGKVNWNDPVVKYIPDFQLYDPYVTRELKIRDLLIHDSGVGNADFLWGAMDISSDEVLKKLSQVKPSYSLRSSLFIRTYFTSLPGKLLKK